MTTVKLTARHVRSLLTALATTAHDALPPHHIGRHRLWRLHAVAASAAERQRTMITIRITARYARCLLTALATVAFAFRPIPNN